ncbi:MAG: GTPase RsgA, partial [Cyclobacteriaceae bacterium]|nr:GTPase RsgA [Cyclobacteriaceae bacterium]
MINTLEGGEYLKTRSLSKSTGTGIHTTTSRELRILQDGGILIDTPGMREIGVTENLEGVSMTFEYIKLLEKECRFNDCTHTGEPGCAVHGAIQQGRIQEEVFEHYKKLEREVARFSASLADRRKKDKRSGKIYKEVVK